MSVINRLKKHILVDGFHVVVDTEKSKGSWIAEKDTGKMFLDCYTQFASQPLGWNYVPLMEKIDYVHRASVHKLANSDMYCETYADFIETFSGVTRNFEKYFFIDGGALAVENALKAAFDWKAQISPQHREDDGQKLDVIHLQQAFHGRSGYTLSLTNTGELKTKWFPKFNWTRVPNPKILPNQEETELCEARSLQMMEDALKTDNVAAIILEPIQGEGGDNHFRNSFFKSIRELADKYRALLIFDEVQTGMGLTGKWWAHHYTGVIPDLMCFGKKVQVCGFCSTDRIQEAPENVFKQSYRINSTWGGNIVDMARSKLIIDIIEQYNLVTNAMSVGEFFQRELESIGNEISNVRGRGLMLAIDLPTSERRDEVMSKLQKDMLALKSGEKSIRFRPPLTFSKQCVNQAITFLKKALS